MALGAGAAEADRPWFKSPDLWYPVLLFLGGILFFSDLLFTSHNLFFRDTLNFHYPLRRVLIDAFARWEIPLWNPYVYLGQPLLANPNYMALYPTNLLHLLLPFNYCFKLHLVLQPLIGGLGIYFLQRRLGIPPMPSFGGAVVYQFSGTVLSFLNLYNIVPAVGLMPWIAWAYYGALHSNWWRRSLLFGLLLGLQALAFEPLIFQCNLWLLAALSLAFVLHSENRMYALGRVLRTSVAGSLYAVALAAVQVIPTLELVPRSARGAGYDFATASGWSMHPADLVNTVIPNLFGNLYTINNRLYWGEAFHTAREPYLVSYFLGAGCLILWLLSFLSARRRLQLVLAGLAAWSVFLALGQYNPVYRWLYDHLPAFQLGRYPSKYFLLGTLSLSILAALGLDVIQRRVPRASSERRWILAFGLLGLAAGLSVIAFWAQAGGDPAAVQAWLRARVEPVLVESKNLAAIADQLLLSLRASGVYLLATSAIVTLAAFWRRIAWPAGLLILVLVAEIVPANLRLSPLISDADVSFVPEIHRYLREMSSKDLIRVAPPTLLRPMPDLQIRMPGHSSAWLTLFYRMSGQPLFGIMSGIQYSVDRSVDHLNTRESDELWRASTRLPEPAALTLLQKTNVPVVLSLEPLGDPRLREIASMDTRSDMPLRVYWLENSLQRAYFVAGVERASSPADALERFIHPDFPFGERVILESAGPALEGDPSGGGVRIAEYESRRIVCEVTATTAGHVVLLDSYYPGWRAYLNGREIPIEKANYAFRAVAVPAGEHRLEFVYHPRTFYVGLGVTILAVLGGIITCFWVPRRFGG